MGKALVKMLLAAMSGRAMAEWVAVDESSLGSETVGRSSAGSGTLCGGNKKTAIRRF